MLIEIDPNDLKDSAPDEQVAEAAVAELVAAGLRLGGNGASALCLLVVTIEELALQSTAPLYAMEFSTQYFATAYATSVRIHKHITERLAQLGADDQPAPGWDQRVLDAIEYEAQRAAEPDIRDEPIADVDCACSPATDCAGGSQ